MVRLTNEDYELVLATLPAALRKEITLAAQTDGESVIFDDDIGGEAYEAMMEYITLHEFTRDYDITPRGRELELIADSIYDQSGGA